VTQNQAQKLACFDYLFFSHNFDRFSARRYVP
jgi:hypothetical protein